MDHRLELNPELRRLATTDSLSGALNRRAFFEQANRLCEQDRANGQPIAALVVDIDNFKHINDGHGHHVGDLAIAAVARILLEAVRPSDLVCRYGGEEFCILLHSTPSAEAGAIAERVRARIDSECGLGLSKVGALRITASLGVCILDARRTNIETLVAYADKALYRSKREGRNRVSVYTSEIDDTAIAKLAFPA